MTYEDLKILEAICNEFGYAVKLYAPESERGLTIINNGIVAAYLKSGSVYALACSSKEFAAELDNYLKAVKGIEDETEK